MEAYEDLAMEPLEVMMVDPMGRATDAEVE